MSQTHLSDVVSFLEGRGFYSAPRVRRISEHITQIGEPGSKDFVNWIVYRHNEKVFIVDTDPFRGTPEKIRVDEDHPWYNTLSVWLMQRTLEQ